jgi:hypothetical protein
MNYGLRMGSAVAKLVSEQEATTQGRIVPAAGIFAESRFNRWLSIVVDVLYAEYGGNGANPMTVYGNDSLAGNKLERVNIRSQGVEVPLQLKLRPPLSLPIAPYVSVGASKAFFLGATSDNFVRKDSSIVEVGLDMTPVVHMSDYAGLGAIGIEVQGARLRWSVEVFARFGLSDFNQPRLAGMTGYAASATGVKVGIGR